MIADDRHRICRHQKPECGCQTFGVVRDLHLKSLLFAYAHQQRTGHIAVIVDFQQRIFRNIIDREVLLCKQRMAGSSEKIDVAGFGEAFVIETRITETLIDYREVHFTID